MAYVERGVVKSQRSIWRLRTITDFFWAIVNFIGVFFSTMFSMEKTDAYRKGSGSSKKWMVAQEVLGVDHMAVAHVAHPEGWTMLEGLIIVPCLPVAHAVANVLRYL
ncbi:hypothetical protein BDE02_05G144600 [Populus trichocarpa]|nr:hypothetical protein BDE02_05G144600 [Populus trichocarpa]